MKLFASKKTPHLGQNEKPKAVSDETKVIPRIENRIKASLAAQKADKKRAALVSICSAVVLLLAVLLVSVGSRIGENSPKTSESPALKESVSSLYPNEEDAEGTADVILPFSPSERDDEMLSVAQGETDGELVKKDNYRNFLFAVYDSKGTSVDTVFVGRLDTVEAKLDIVNIPRDTLINVSWEIKKISTVMLQEEGNSQRFLNELSSILGFSIDYYAFIEAKTVTKIVDAIGGLYYTVPINMISTAENVNISSGLQWLNGARAQQMLKFRIGDNGSGYAGGEVGRIETVQDFLMEILALYISGSEGPNVEKVIAALTENSEGNIDEDIWRRFAEILRETDGSNIHFATMPGQNVRIKNITYYEIAAVEWTEMVNEYLNPFDGEVVLHNLDILMYDPAADSVMSSCGEMVDMDSFY